jgi:hypothetical protein
MVGSVISTIQTLIARGEDGIKDEICVLQRQIKLPEPTAGCYQPQRLSE